MPFILTCDHCQAKLRTATEVALGRVVTCPKCKEQFEARSDNRREEGKAAPAWEVIEDDPPPRRSASRREFDDDDDDWQPRRREGRDSRRKSGGSKLALWIGSGAAVLLLIGVGVYFATRGGSNGVTADRQGARAAEEIDARPKRELPKELFAYWPGDLYGIEYRDHALAVETGYPLLPPESPVKELGLTLDRITHSFYFFKFDGSMNGHLYVLKEPFDLPAAVAKDKGKWKEIPVAGGKVFEDGSERQVVQPKSTHVAVIKQSWGLDKKTALAEQLLRGGPIPDELWALLQEVSAFPAISWRKSGLGGEIMHVVSNYQVDGYSTTTTHRDNLTCWSFPNPADANRAEAAKKQFDNQNNTGSRAGREVRYWIKGNRLYRLIREQQAEKK